MAYSPPTFNLFVDIYAGDPTFDFTLKSFRLQTLGQLRGFGRHPGFGSRVIDPLMAGITGLTAAAADLLVPALTDIRDIFCDGQTSDVVEVPSGSGRWYVVGLVEDVAKGFPNEYRRAELFKVTLGGTSTTFPLWPAPIP